jgi:hypothetical protein
MSSSLSGITGFWKNRRNFIAVALLAELHGLMGYFPDCVRLRLVEGARPPRFEVAEILNLQAYREAGRSHRIAK